MEDITTSTFSLKTGVLAAHTDAHHDFGKGKLYNKDAVNNELPQHDKSEKEWTSEEEFLEEAISDNSQNYKRIDICANNLEQAVSQLQTTLIENNITNDIFIICDTAYSWIKVI
jgi:predicted Rossmann fold nucleotide-binding protein DprA/Smf involved in DNA uptake